MDARDWDRRWTDKLLHAHGEPSSVVLAALEGLAPGRALDLGCGNGRHAMWLAERGWRVTAVDFSTEALRQARERAATSEWRSTGWRPISPPMSRAASLRPRARRVPPRPGHERARDPRQSRRSGRRRRDAAARRSRPDEHRHGRARPDEPGVLYTPADIVPELPELEIERAEQVRRPTELDDGSEVEAVDALVLATRR